MQVPFTNEANPFMIDVGLLCEVVAAGMSCFSLSVQQAGELVGNIIDIHATYSGNFNTLEPFLRGALYGFKHYESELQMLNTEAQSQSGEYQPTVNKFVNAPSALVNPKRRNTR